MKLLDLPESTVFTILSYLFNHIQLQEVANLYYSCKPLQKCLQSYVAQMLFFKLNHRISYNVPITLSTAFAMFCPKIAIIGGLVNNRKCDVFLPHRGSFRRIAGIGLKRVEEFEAVFYRGILVVISGSDDSAVGNVEAYHIESNSWHIWPPLPRKLTAIGCAVMPGGAMYVTGGTDRSNSRRSDEIYFLEHPGPLNISQHGTGLFQGSWQRSSMVLSKGRSHHGCTVFRGNIWVAGGLLTGRMVASNCAEVINLTTGVTIPVANMLRHRLLPKLLVINDNLYAVGGDVEGTAHAVGSIERYDIQKEAWMFVTFFPQPRRRVRCAIAAYGSRIYVFGGSDGPLVLSSWDYYDTRDRYWASQVQSRLLAATTSSEEAHLDELATGHVQVQLSAETLQQIRTLSLTTISTQPGGLKSSAAVYCALE